MSAERLDLTWLPTLGGLALKSLLVFLVAGAALLALRRASASARHLVCLLALAGQVALLLLSLGLPGWRLAVLAASASSPAAPAAIDGRGAGEEPIPNPLPSGEGAKAVPVGIPYPLPVGEGGEERARRGSSVAAPHPFPFPWPSFLAALWLGGALLVGLRPLLGLWGITRLSQESAAVADAPTLALADECGSALGLTRTPALHQADAPVPMTWGWRHPVVLLPNDAPGWPPDRLQAVLLHELAHVRRRDWLSHRFADIVCALYWFHPLVWLTARRLRMESEIACDDLVLTSGVAAPDYARHLLDVARALRPASAAILPKAAIAMARTARIEGRLTMILDSTRSRRAPTRRALLITLGLGAAALVPLAMLRPAARAQAARPPQAPSIRPGLAVVLAGITEAGSPGGLWWDQKGIPLPTPIYEAPNQNQPASSLARQGLKTVLFAFRLPPEARDVTVGYDFPRSSAFQMVDVPGPGASFKGRGGDGRTEAQVYAKTSGAHIVYATLPASAVKASLGIKTASGPWTTAAVERQPFKTSGFRLLKPGEKFVFWRVTWVKNEELLNKGETLVKISIASKSDTFSAATNKDTRVVAVDMQGHELLPSVTSDIGVRGIGSGVMARFPERPDQIKQFAVQTRPFQVVVFRDIALRPAN